MLIKKISYTLLALISFQNAMAQSSYLTINGKEEWLLNRLEIKTRTNYLTTGIKPYNRKTLVTIMEQLDTLNSSTNQKSGINETDRYNLQRFLMANSEWSKPREIFNSEKKVLNLFYGNRANMVEELNKDFTFIANPIFQFQQGGKADNTSNTFINQRGVNVRGTIDNKIGFYFYFTENQERHFRYLNDWRAKFISVPGAGYIKNFKDAGFDYFDGRGGVSWKVAKFMDMQLAYDRNFIGNGYRSLFLSDFSTNYMFLKIQTRWKKFHYQNIFAELTTNRPSGSDRIYPRKYFRASYLNYQPFKWMNVGLFEGLMLGKNDKLSMPLFNPIMFTNVSNNEKDKSYGGFDVKLNMLKRVQVYAQVMIDNIGLNNTILESWNNRYSYQLGLKYIDAFNLKNFDVQVEHNSVRPFMYGSSDSVSTYTHYNQPLAHPLGANFNEVIFIARYQPLKKLYLESKVVVYQQGLDSMFLNNNINFGNNIFRLNQVNRPYDIGWKTGKSGNQANCTIISLLASYEFKENLFFDVSYLHRNFDIVKGTSSNTGTFSLGVRWNIGRRDLLF